MLHCSIVERYYITFDEIKIILYFSKINPINQYPEHFRF